jgi:hypothetical protein
MINQNAKKFFDAAQSQMEYLWSRWQDEKQYENINDYSKPLEPIAEECGVKIVKMTARPFSCQFSVDGILWELRMTGTAYSFKGLKRL